MEIARFLVIMRLKGTKMKFLDKAKIHIKAGDGGNGAASFRRETARCAILTSHVISGEF